MAERSLNGKTVAVTGADGFIGSHLVETLVRNGANVRALSQYTSQGTCGWLDSIAPEFRSEFSVMRGDVRDPHQMVELVSGSDTVFHLAALIAIPYSYEAPQSYVDTNITGTLNVLEAARRADVRRVVHTSTSEVYGTARFTPITEDHPLQGQSPYSASKIAADHMAEAYARSFELPVVILRPFNTYGPRQSERAVIPTIIRQALDDGCEEIRLGDLTPVRDFNYVEDIADAFVAAGVAELSFGVAYNAGTEKGVTIGDLAAKIVDLTGSAKPVTQENKRFRPSKSEVFTLLAESSRFREESGWKSGVDLEAGLVRTIDWWSEQVKAGAIRASADYLV